MPIAAKPPTNLSRSASRRATREYTGCFARLAMIALLVSGLAGCGSTYSVAPTPASSPPRTSGAPAVPANPPSAPWVGSTEPAPWTPAPAPISSASLAGRTIVVDAGHGGKDPGTQQLSPVPEKHITLAIAKEVEQRLVRLGARVRMTRTGDTYPTLDERAALADQLRADLLVSIHADSAESKTANGPAVWIARNALPASVRIAEAVSVRLKESGLPSRGLRRADFQVLVKHSRPAMLVECGFLTNAMDATKLNEPAYQRKIADAIAEGIARAGM